MVHFRNTRLAHFNYKLVHEEIPNLRWAMHSVYFYREWLLPLLRAQQQIDRNIKLTETKGPAMLALFKNQIAEIFRTDP